MKEIQECVDSYKIGNGVHSFDITALAIDFFYACVIFILLSQRVQHTIISNIPANNTWNVLFCFIWSTSWYSIAAHENVIFT